MANHPGNGARELVLKYFSNQGYGGDHTVDHFLAWLGAEGFVIQPATFEGDEEDALPGAAMERPEGAAIYPLNLYRRRPHP